MKKNKIILVTCTIILVIFILFILFILLHTEKNNISNKLTKANNIIAIKFLDDGSVEEKKITNNNDINELIKIIQNRKKISNDEDILYRKIPHYKLKLLDKHDNLIIEINIFNYSIESSWISFDNEDSYYKIDVSALLKILDF